MFILCSGFKEEERVGRAVGYCDLLVFFGSLLIHKSMSHCGIVHCNYIVVEV